MKSTPDTDDTIYVIEEQRNGTWIQFYDEQVDEEFGETGGIYFQAHKKRQALKTARNMTVTYGLPMRAAKYKRV